MPCVPIPIPGVPAAGLPLPLTLPIPDPPDLAVPAYCCKLPPLQVDLPPIVLPPIPGLGVIVLAMNVLRKSLLTYLDGLPNECPLE